MTGKPKPPFRIMAPRGAPIKKKIKQAKAKINFRCHSTSCLFIVFFLDNTVFFEVVTKFFVDLAIIRLFSIINSCSDWLRLEIISFGKNGTESVCEISISGDRRNRFTASELEKSWFLLIVLTKSSFLLSKSWYIESVAKLNCCMFSMA